MNKGIKKGLFLMTFFLMITPVKAMGNAKIEFTGNTNVEIGETFKIDMIVTDIYDTYDGIVSFGGNLDFDENMLEYVSSKGAQNPYLFQMNENAKYKIAGLDFTLDNGIRENSKVYEFTFKAIKEGQTSINFKNAKLTDSKDYIDTVVLNKNVTINSKGIENNNNNNNNEVEIIDAEISESSKAVKTNIQIISAKETKTKNDDTISIEQKAENSYSKKEKKVQEKIKSALGIFIKEIKNKFKFFEK